MSSEILAWFLIGAAAAGIYWLGHWCGRRKGKSEFTLDTYENWHKTTQQGTDHKHRRPFS